MFALFVYLKVLLLEEDNNKKATRMKRYNK